MTTYRRMLCLAALAGGLLLAWQAGPLISNEGPPAAAPTPPANPPSNPTTQQRLDRGKNFVIEPAVKDVVRASSPTAPATPRLDVGKGSLVPAAPAPAAPRVDVGKARGIPAVANPPATPRLDVSKGEAVLAPTPPVAAAPVAPAANLDVGKQKVRRVAAPAPPAPPARPRLDVGKGPARRVPFAGGPPPVATPPAPPAANLDVGKALAPRPAAPPAPPVVAAPEFRGIEAPVKDVLATTSTPARNTDIGKTGIISSPELVGPGSGRPPGPAEGPARSETPARFANPKVEPGKVRWHKTVDDARAAAAKTGKPVLLFQMMGKLDDEFC